MRPKRQILPLAMNITQSKTILKYQLEDLIETVGWISSIKTALIEQEHNYKRPMPMLQR